MMLQEPIFSIDETKKIQFQKIYQEALESDSYIDYSLDIPKYEFLSFILRHHNVLLHGSNDTDIDILEPHQSNDENPWGNEFAVYACSDYLLPIFYAVLDRTRCQGIIHSGLGQTDSSPLKYYTFKVPQLSLTQAPWKKGMIYLVLKETFVQQRDHENLPLVEWISQSVVTPIARLLVYPQDFPFLNQVQGY